MAHGHHASLLLAVRLWLLLNQEMKVDTMCIDLSRGNNKPMWFSECLLPASLSLEDSCGFMEPYNQSSPNHQSLGCHSALHWARNYLLLLKPLRSGGRLLPQRMWVLSWWLSLESAFVQCGACVWVSAWRCMPSRDQWEWVLSELSMVGWRCWTMLERVWFFTRTKGNQDLP